MPLEIINGKTNYLAGDDTNIDKNTNTDQNKASDEIKNADDEIIRNDSTVTRRRRVATLNANTIRKVTNN